MDWSPPDNWTQDEIDQYEKYGIKPDDLLDQPFSAEETLSMDMQEADYMNLLHDEFQDYDANFAV